jgi:hypothetical protein
MKLNKSFIGINYHISPMMKKTVVDQLMDLRTIPGLCDIANLTADERYGENSEHTQQKLIRAAGWSQSDYNFRRDNLNAVNSNLKHKLYYITRKVQDHSSLIKFEKIKLGWFRNVKSQSSTYILSKEEFFRFRVVEGKVIYVMHFFKDPNIDPYTVQRMKSAFGEQKHPLKDFLEYRFETFIIYLDEEKYPDGYMPDNEIIGQNFKNKERFIKLLLFIELSEVEIIEVGSNRKARLNPNWEKSLEGRVKNETEVDVILVNTSWNKITINTEGFDVSGHIRIQPYGPGRSYYKPIWIEEYQKQGFVRYGKGTEPASH